MVCKYANELGVILFKINMKFIYWYLYSQISLKNSILNIGKGNFNYKSNDRMFFSLKSAWHCIYKDCLRGGSPMLGTEISNAKFTVG